MPWLNHPAYRPARDRLIDRFRARTYLFGKLKHIIFLCGGNESRPRELLLQYLRKFHQDALVFRADDVWAQIAESGDTNALQMEEELARLADAVIVIVESPGTFAELGAFSISPPLRDKLLPILEVAYKDSPSFINSGPVRWIDQHSVLGPSIFTRLDMILESGGEVSTRLDRLPQVRAFHFVEESELDDKALVFVLADLVSIIGPASIEDIDFYVKQLFPRPQVVKVPQLLGLAAALDLLKWFEDSLTSQRFYVGSRTGRAKPFLYKRKFELSRERARLMSVLLRIPEAARVVLMADGVPC